MPSFLLQYLAFGLTTVQRPQPIKGNRNLHYSPESQSRVRVRSLRTENQFFLEMNLKLHPIFVMFPRHVAGLNRSTTLLAAYMMIKHRMTLVSVVERLHAARPFILSNLGFRQQVCTLNRTLKLHTHVGRWENSALWMHLFSVFFLKDSRLAWPWRGSRYEFGNDKFERSRLSPLRFHLIVSSGTIFLSCLLFYPTKIYKDHKDPQTLLFLIHFVKVLFSLPHHRPNNLWHILPSC